MNSGEYPSPQEPQQPFNEPPQQSYSQQPYPQQPYPQWQPPQQQPPTQYPPNYPPGYQPPYPPPQYMPPPPPPTKKKRGPLFWILVVLGVVLVIGVCSAVMNAASHPNVSTTAATPTAGIKPDMTATAVAIAMATQDAVTPSPTIQKVGDTITLNGVDATLTKVKVGPVDQYSTPKPGYEFVTVHVKLKNTSDTEQTYNQLAFHVKSSTGNITDVDAATYGEGINDLGYGTLSSGGTAEGNIVFQVKINDHKVMLTWQPNQFTDSAGDNGWLLGI